MLTVDSMGMQSGVLGGHWLVAKWGQGSCLIGLSISYLFLQGPRWTDGGKGDTGDREEKRVKQKERRQKCTRDNFVH